MNILFNSAYHALIMILSKISIILSVFVDRVVLISLVVSIFTLIAFEITHAIQVKGKHTEIS